MLTQPTCHLRKYRNRAPYIRKYDPTFIINCVCSVSGVTKYQITSRVRKREFVYARQIAVIIMRRLTKLSLNQIGDLFCIGHATCLHAIREYGKDEEMFTKYGVPSERISLYNRSISLIK